MLFIGPWDLGNNLGYPVQGDFAPELKAAISRILKAATDAGKKAGIYCPSGEFARRYADEGFHMVRLNIALATRDTLLTFCRSQS